METSLIEAPHAISYRPGWNIATIATIATDPVPGGFNRRKVFQPFQPFHGVGVFPGTEPEPVRRAADWCDLLEQHARRIYQAGSDGDMGPAQTLAERIAESLPNPFRARDVVRKGWSGLAYPDEVDRALGILEEHGWVCPVEAPAGEKGGRPTVEYHVNPVAISGNPSPKAPTKPTKPGLGTPKSGEPLPQGTDETDETLANAEARAEREAIQESDR